MYMITGAPLQGKWLEKLQLFLASCQLETDPALDFTVLVLQDEQIIATGSLCGDTIRCVAVAPAHQGEDLCATVITALVQRAAEKGIGHLLLYTKPHNGLLFAPLGFHPVIRTGECLLMENKKDGLRRYLDALEKPAAPCEHTGSIVMHADPFTLGHRHLIRTAAAQCGCLHVFVLSEDRGFFGAESRLRMVKSGCADLPNVHIHPTGPYMVSSATFPAYFIRDKARAPAVHCELDVRLFGERIAPALHITRRYAGTEPLCPVTHQYNQTMRRLLPGYGIDFIEIPRLAVQETCISASRVRALIRQEQWADLAQLVPPTTLDFISSAKGGSPCPIPSECSET